MKYFIKEFIWLTPILLMGVSFLSVIFPWLGFPFEYIVWGNIGGFSLLTNLVLFERFYYGKYCIFTKLFPVGLILVNIVNIWGFYNPKYYNVWYEIVILSVTSTALLIYQLSKSLNK